VIVLAVLIAALAALFVCVSSVRIVRQYGPGLTVITPPADPSLLRPWDREQESQIAVVCPSVAHLPLVVDAVNASVAQANTDYRHELDHQRACAVKLETDEAQRDQYLHDIQRAIDERYHNTDVAA
jgi:hypothetical protein